MSSSSPGLLAPPGPHPSAMSREHSRQSLQPSVVSDGRSTIYLTPTTTAHTSVLTHSFPGQQSILQHNIGIYIHYQSSPQGAQSQPQPRPNSHETLPQGRSQEGFCCLRCCSLFALCCTALCCPRVCPCMYF